jgi:nicotinamidase/pyrazinamidase
MNALIIVDVQNDFIPGGALAVPEGDRVVPVCNQLAKSFDLVVATQDWHPPDHGSFAASHPDRNVGDVIDLNGLRQILWPVHCVQNTRGAQFVHGLDTNSFARIFQKGTDPAIDSYSGFYDNGHRKSTGLADYFKSKNVADVFVCGLATDYCVKFTALDAKSLGLNVTLIEDACRGVNLRPGDVDGAVGQMRQAGIAIAQSTSLK